MTRRENVLAIFRHDEHARPVFEPLVEHWFNTNKRQGTLPPRYRDMSILDIYDDLEISCRACDFYQPALKFNEDPSVRVESFTEGNKRVNRWITPLGSLEEHVITTDFASATKKFMVETREDVPILEYILSGRTWEFDLDLYEEADRAVGDRGLPLMFGPRVNLQYLFIEAIGQMNTVYMLHDAPETVDHLVSVIDEADERWFKLLLYCPAPIVCFGDNLDHHFLSPPLFERYVLPVHQDRCRRIRAVGKFSHAHWDGSVKKLLPYAKLVGLDGIEALTPVPQGDVTLEEIKEALGDELILLDGIPMVMFLPGFPVEELLSCARRLIELFSPNLIMGISDELSPVCDVERVRMVGEVLKEYNARCETSGAHVH